MFLSYFISFDHIAIKSLQKLLEKYLYRYWSNLQLVCLLWLDFLYQLKINFNTRRKKKHVFHAEKNKTRSLNQFKRLNMHFNLFLFLFNLNKTMLIFIRLKRKKNSVKKWKKTRRRFKRVFFAFKPSQHVWYAWKTCLFSPGNYFIFRKNSNFARIIIRYFSSKTTRFK